MVPAPMMVMPVSVLPEMRLPLPGALPPTMLLVAIDWMTTPSWLAKAPAPVPLVPMKLPSTMLLLVPLRSEEHTSELQSRRDLVCRLLLEKKKQLKKKQQRQKEITEP